MPAVRLENMRSSIFCAAFVVCAAAVAQPEDRNDVIQILPKKRSFELTWADTEDALKGVIAPDVLREGEPVRVSVTVGSFYGAPFDGPVTLALRPEGAQGQTESFTAMPDGGTWKATFVPQSSGAHVLDVSFRTTRHKVLHGKVIVDQARLPSAYAWALGVGLVGIAVLLGVLRVLKKPPAAAPAPPGDPIQ